MQTEIYPYVSVIIPVKNEKAYISACIDSILAQDYSGDRYEIIVVDNGSGDGTLEILRQYQEQQLITLFQYDGSTIASVRNYGAQKARGEVIAFLDGDCTADINWLTVGTQMLYSGSQVGCVGFYGAHPRPGTTWVEKNWHCLNSSARYEGTKSVRWLSTFNLILPRTAFEKVGGFNSSLETCEDVEFGYRLSFHFQMLCSDQVIVQHHDESKTVRQFIRKELWRGRSNFRSFLKVDNKIAESPSVFIPFVYLAGVTLIASYLAYSVLLAKPVQMNLWFLACLATFCPPIVLGYTKASWKLRGFEWVQVPFLFFLYLVARGLAFLPIRF